MEALNTPMLAHQTLYFKKRFRGEHVAWCLLAVNLLEVEQKTSPHSHSTLMLNTVHETICGEKESRQLGSSE